MPRARKRGRPSLGAAARSKVIAVRLTGAQHDAIASYVAKENAEVNATDGATTEDRKPATVASWVRDVIEEAIP